MSVVNRESFTAVVVIMLTAFYGAGCETGFDPLQENDQYAFSMYGALDLHADTQWVRVMPIGETLIPTKPEPNDVEVTLIRESTREATILNDSLFVFGGNARVWNYWTTTPLYPNEEYTLCAKAPDDRSSCATVTIPSALPLPMVKYSTESEVGTINGSSVDSMIMADTKFFVQVITDAGLTPETELVFSHLDEMYVDPNGEYRFTIDATLLIARELNVRPSSFIVNRRELHVASGSEDWPDLSDLREEEIVLPDVVSNVDNGTGFIAGIASRKVPLESCFDDEDTQIACE